MRGALACATRSTILKRKRSALGCVDPTGEHRNRIGAQGRRRRPGQTISGRAEHHLSSRAISAIRTIQHDRDQFEYRRRLWRHYASHDDGSQRDEEPQSGCHEVGAAIRVGFEHEDLRVSLTTKEQRRPEGRSPRVICLLTPCQHDMGCSGGRLAKFPRKNCICNSSCIAIAGIAWR